MTHYGITPKQKKILDFILKYTQRNNFPPTQKEIARHFNFRSLGTVQNYIIRLERSGFLKKTWNARRGIFTPNNIKNNDSFEVPLVGNVSAGAPIEAIENVKHIEIPSFLHKNKKQIALIVKGDSMIGEGILDGDIAIIQKQPHATNGQTVVALINNEATIKKFYKKKFSVELRAANPKYKPIIVHNNEAVDFMIEGILNGIIRGYK